MGSTYNPEDKFNEIYYIETEKAIKDYHEQKRKKKADDVFVEMRHTFVNENFVHILESDTLKTKFFLIIENLCQIFISYEEYEKCTQLKIWEEFVRKN